MDDSSYSIAANISRLNLSKDSEINDLTQILKSIKDWPNLIDVLIAQGVFLLFCQAIDSTDAKAVVPDTVLKSITEIRYRLTALNMAQEAVLEILLDVLNNENVPVLMPTGLFLDQIVYSETHNRFSNDIDIFVHDADFDKAYKLLISKGFQRIPNKHGIALAYHSGLDVMIELETLRRQKKARFRETYIWDPDDIWENAVEQKLCNGVVLRMQPEHQLLYLALHLSERHYFERLIWFKDLAEVISFYEGSLDWERLAVIAREWQASSYAYFSLLLAKELVGAAVPENALQAMKPNYLSARVFEWCLFRDETPRLPMPITSPRFQLFLLIGDSRLRRIWSYMLLPYHTISLSRDFALEKESHKKRSIRECIT